MPYIAQVAVGKHPYLKIYGDHYDTVDGTGVRDYIHIMDLARGHLSALEYLQRNDILSYDIFNLGTGKGYSVKEMVKGMEKASEKKVGSIFRISKALDKNEDRASASGRSSKRVL